MIKVPTNTKDYLTWLLLQTEAYDAVGRDKLKKHLDQLLTP